MKNLNDIATAYFFLDANKDTEGKRTFRKTSAGIFVPSCIEMGHSFFAKFGLSRYKKFLDIGSGDGRIVRTASLFTDSTGIEADKTMFDESERIGPIPGCKPFRFIHGDYMDPFFFFHEFDFIYWFPDKDGEEVEEKLLWQMTGVLAIKSRIYVPKKLKKIEEDEENNFYIYSNPNNLKRVA